jgi:hypothetical protein
MTHLKAVSVLVVNLDIIALLITGSDPCPVDVSGANTIDFILAHFFGAGTISPAPGQADLLEFDAGPGE